jgi:hypothetical protein
MTRIIEDRKAHYETHEVPFGRSYEWQPERIIFECDCGQRSTVTATSPTNTRCHQCGADNGVVVRGIRRREYRLPDETIHPWLHDAREQEEQHHRDETAYPKDSPWRYNDITSR